MNLQVIKRDGSLEEYNEAKITKVVIAAGLNPNEAQELSSVVSESFKKMNSSKTSSLQIKDVVTKELKNINQDAANLFSWYQKTKE